MSSRSAIQLWLPLRMEGVLLDGESITESPSYDEQLIERVVERDNLIRALRQADYFVAPGVPVLYVKRPSRPNRPGT